MPDPDTLDGFGEVRGKAQPLPPKQAKALAKAEREADKLREHDELDDAEIETLSECTYIWSDRQKARAGAIVSVTHDGKLAVMRGLIRPEDMKAAKPTDEESPPVRRSPSEGGGFSAALADDLTDHRTAALRAMLADRPSVALAAVAHALAQTVFYMSDDSGFAIRAVSPALRAEGIEGSPAAKSLADQHAAWQSRLPDDEAALWDWLLTQDGGAVTGLLAYCAACTVKPERDPRADQLAAAVALDMAQWWQPTVAGYLGRVSKTLICEAVTEGASAQAADNLAAMKKADMADHASRLLAGTGWLPAMPRAA